MSHYIYEAHSRGGPDNVYGPFANEDEAMDFGMTLREDDRRSRWSYARLRKPPVGGYSFLGGLYCDDTCVVQDLLPITVEIHLVQHNENTEAVLDDYARFLGIDRESEDTYSSDQFPKVVKRGGFGSGAYCHRCERELR